jgi:NADH-quinone oxidoreductase subunit C
MSDTQQISLVERLAARFGDLLTVSTARNEVTAELAASDLIAVATALRDEAPFRFSIFIDT